MESEYWTPARVREFLPTVDVLVDGRVYRMITAGRKLKFASVRPFEIGSATAYEFSWETIAQALNKGVPLRV